MADDDPLADVCEGKTGPELFRELLRLFSEAQVEDYYKMGQWQNKVMRVDYVLIEAHRKEAGAPPPPPLSEIPEVKLPEQKIFLPGFARLGLPGVTMAGNSPVATPSPELRNCAIWISRNKLDPSRSKALLMNLSTDNRRQVMEDFKSDQIGMEATDELENYIKENVKPGSNGQTVPTPASKVAAPGKVNGTAAASFSPEELKQTALFIAKNKLDPTRAKTGLMKLTADQRQSVIAGFVSSASGLEATGELERYIADCQENGFGVEERPAKRAKV